MSARRSKARVVAFRPVRPPARTERDASWSEAARRSEQRHWRAVTLRACAAGLVAALMTGLFAGFFLDQVLPRVPAILIAVAFTLAVGASDGKKILDALVRRGTAVRSAG